MKPWVETIRLLGRDIPVLPASDGTPRADDNGKPASARPVTSYVTSAFGNRLLEVRETMERVAASLPPEELNRVGFRLYERFRPEVPDGVSGWGAKGVLHLDRTADAAAS